MTSTSASPGAFTENALKWRSPARIGEAGRDPETGDVCGIYFFESADALAAFRNSELARTIPSAYEAVDVRREVYDVLYSLWPDRGPLPAFERAVT